MNITITPTAVAVDTAANLLAFLEMAQNPSKLKAVLAQLKAAHDALAEESLSAKATKDTADAALKDAEQKMAQAASQQAAANAESQRAAFAAAEAQAVRDVSRQDRQQFDAWMAEERDKLAADKAKVASDAAANVVQAQRLQEQQKSVVDLQAEALAMQATAESVRDEYQQKLAALKSMI